MRYVLTVTVPDAKTFEAYWYGTGTVLTVVPAERAGWLTYTVDYETDQYRAEYQAGRFASGLYFAKVTAVASTN